MSRSTFGDVVVLLPGITGSVLVQGEGRRAREVWAPKPGAVLRGLLSLGRSLQALAVENDDWRAEEPGGGGHPTPPCGAVRFHPGPMESEGYSGL